MNMTRSALALALCVGAMLGIGRTNAAIITTQTAVEQGAWSSDLEVAKAKALQNNVPLFVFWGNAGCSHCEKLEKLMNGSKFTDWMAENKIYMVFHESDTTTKKWIMGVAKENGRKISAYPFALVYWPKNAEGKEVLQAFSAYKGNMSDFGATSKQDDLTQLTTTLDYLLAGWNPGGVTPIDPVDPVEPEHVHAWSAWAVTTPATCTTPGVETRTCSVAGCTVGSQTRQIAARNHDWSAWEVVTPAEVGVAGLKRRTCSRCDAVETAAIPALDPTPDREEVNPASFFGKAKKLSAIAYEGDEIFGTASISTGKYSSKKKNVKVTFKIVGFNGKTYSKAVNVVPNEYGDLLDVAVAFKSPVGVMTFDLVNNEGELEAYGEGGDYTVESGDVVVGGALENEEMTLSVEFDDLELDDENYDFIVDPPSSASAVVKKGTVLDFGKAPKIKYEKFSEDGEKWYDLKEFDEEKQPNVNAISLTYKSATGAFSGSFKVYASNAGSIDSGKKPKLKTYSGTVSGVVVNGEGVGKATIKIGKRTYTGTCTLD